MSRQRKTVLLIGYPGVAALNTALVFAREDNTAVKLLVSSQDLNRVRDQFASVYNNVEIIEGNADKIDLGLRGSDYLDLAKQITSIVCAVTPLSHLSDSSFFKKMFHISREVIEISQMSPHLERVCVLSNIDIAGNHKGLFAEHDLDMGQTFAGNEQATRLKIERIFRRFMDVLPITILRIGHIIGDEKGAYPLVKLLLAEQVIGRQRSAHYRPFTLINNLGEIIALLASSPFDSKYNTLHLISHCRLSHREMADKVRRLARKLIPASFDLSMGARRSLNIDSTTSFSLTKDFIRAQNSRTRVTSVFTQSLLKELGVEIRALDDDILVGLVEKAVEEIVGFR